jgi:hypothetical protein
MSNLTLDKAKDQFIKALQERRDELMSEANEIDRELSELGGTTKRSSRKRSRKGENRAEQFTKLVTDRPGLTVASAAHDMGIEPNYLYRVAKDLVDKGEVSKRGRKYFPISGEVAPAQDEVQDEVRDEVQDEVRDESAESTEGAPGIFA